MIGVVSFGPTIFTVGALASTFTLTLCSSFIFPRNSWPHVLPAEALLHLWHTNESLGNTVIFFLACAVTGNVMYEIEPLDICAC